MKNKQLIDVSIVKGISIREFVGFLFQQKEESFGR